MAFLDEKAVELDDLGKRLEEAHIDLGEQELRWEQDLDTALIEIVEDYERRGERVPGADLRLAMSRKRTGFEVYADYRRAKTLVEAIEKRVRRVETAVSARQSTLRRMEAEAKVPTFDPETGEVFGAQR